MNPLNTVTHLALLHTHTSRTFILPVNPYKIIHLVMRSYTITHAHEPIHPSEEANER